VAFYFSRRKLRPAEEAEATELNIVPYLDILMNLIMFMLLSITGLSQFGILNVNAPSYGAASTTQQDPADQPKLLLSVLIQKKGFYVAGTGAVLGQQAGSAQGAANGTGPTIPIRSDGSFDFPALTAQMVTIKKDFPTETKVIVGAEGDIPYETLVETMDSVREGPQKQLLFPDVTLATM
jgi:biopolymer transport protein ExbD